MPGDSISFMITHNAIDTCGENQENTLTFAFTTGALEIASTFPASSSSTANSENMGSTTDKSP